MQKTQIEDIRFAIGIPTVNRWDLLRPSLHLYLNDFPNTRIYVLDNGNQARDVVHDNIVYLTDPRPSVASSWNYLCERIFQHNDYSMILNDDIYSGRNEYEIKNMLFYDRSRPALITAPRDFCVFILPKETYALEIFGIQGFNEKFSRAYYEDADMLRRLKLAGMGVAKWVALEPMIYRDNSSSARDSTIREDAKRNKELYLKMWGGLPGEEKFPTPYGIKKKR